MRKLAKDIPVDDPIVVSEVLPPEVTVETIGTVLTADDDTEADEEEVAEASDEPEADEPVADDAADEKSAMAASVVPEAEAWADWQYSSPYSLTWLMSVPSGHDSVEQSRTP